LKKINVQQYIALEDKSIYNALLSHLNPINLYNVEISNMSYTNVRYCIRLMSELNNWGNVKELFELCFNDIDFMNMDVVSYFHSKNYLLQSFKIIVDNETKVSKSGNFDIGKWKFAGGDRLKPFNDFLPLDQLAQRYGGSPFDWGRKPYGEVFYLIAMTKTSNEVNENYNKQK
jgi:hypothetical protein